VVTTSNIDENNFSTFTLMPATQDDLAKITKSDLLSAVLFSTLAELAPTPPESQPCQQRLEYHQMNVIGNLQLIEILRDAKKLASGVESSTPARKVLIGVPMMMMGNPDMGDTTEWYQQHDRTR
jgi:hypothetical protein